MKRGQAAEILSAFFILLFTYTAISKLADIEGLRQVLQQTLPGPEQGYTVRRGTLRTSTITGADVLAWTVPLTELAIVGLLFFPKTRLNGLRASMALLCVFTMYLLFMVLFVPHLPCSCGGVLSGMSWTAHIFLNVAFMVLAVIAIRLYKTAYIGRGP